MPRGLAQCYMAHNNNIMPIDWSLGILYNVHKFPIYKEGNEQIQLGFNLAHGTEILHQSTWGFIEEVVVLTPSNMGMAAIGWKGRDASTRSSYQAVAKSSGENKDTHLLKNAVDGVWLHNQNNIHTIKWGVPRQDLGRLEDQLHKQQNPFITTWHSPTPPCLL